MKSTDVRCDVCAANIGDKCTGTTNGNSHWPRHMRAIIRETLQAADTLALDNARDRRKLEELLVKALR